jgi:hypothetical protein
MNHVDRLSSQVTSDAQEGKKTFHVTIAYDGHVAFPEGSATVQFRLANVPEEQAYDDKLHTVQIVVRDGLEKMRPIPVKQTNIEAFNSYANTEVGLKRHYQLVENVELHEPPDGESNWTAIGTYRYVDGEYLPFTGSFDGGGFSISGLVIHRPEEDSQGMFGYIRSGAVIENLGLIGGSVVGLDYVGGVVGVNGWSNDEVGSTVQNCYVTGTVSGEGAVGGVVGLNFGTVQNCYATGDVNGSSFVGGVVGYNYHTVQNCVALSPSVSATEDNNTYIGRVVGYNMSGVTLSNNHARDDMALTYNDGNSNYEPTGGADSKDGQATSEYENQDFWVRTMGWRFSDVWQWGPGNLPILKNVGGEQRPSVKSSPGK